MNENDLVIRERVESSDRLAWNLKNGAEIMGLSYDSVHKEIRRRKIFPTATFKLLTREEMLRYLREEVQIARRRRCIRTPKTTPTP